MSWIQEEVNAELARRAEIRAFMMAYKKYIGALTKSLNSDIEEFRALVPNDKIEWLAPSPDITQLNHDFGGLESAKALLSADPIRKMFVLNFPLTPSCSQAIPAEVINGEFTLDYSKTAIRPATIGQYILTPVLFPAKASDPEMVRSLKPRFGKE